MKNPAAYDPPTRGVNSALEKLGRFEAPFPKTTGKPAVKNSESAEKKQRMGGDGHVDAEGREEVA